MRPKKKILLIDSNEERRSVRKFVLINRGFIVQAVANAWDAAEAAKALDFDLAIGVWPFEGADLATLLDELQRRHSQMKSMVIADRLTERPPMLIVDAVLLKGQCSQFEIYERAKLLSARKRGPRKFMPAGQRTTFPACPGMTETLERRTA